MIKRPLWKVTICTSAEAEEAAAELLQQRLGTNVSTYTSLKTGITEVSVYLPKKPDWAATKPELAASASRLTSSGLEIGPWRVSLLPLRHQNWAESWKKHFKPLVIGAQLMIKPPWSKRRPRPGQELVIIEPGLSFGTGQHPTTAFCLRELCHHRRVAGQPPSFLDLGTGSGILAISAARLGYSPIQALDFDADAVRVASSNARANGLEQRIVFVRQDLARLPEHPRNRFSLICANLISNLLIQERDRIIARLEPGGSLVLAGILKTEFHRLSKTYEAAGMVLQRCRTAGEWKSGTFARRSRAD